MIKKILLATDFYLPKPLANGVCTHQLALALKEKGYEVHVTAFRDSNDLFEDEIEQINIHRIKPRLFYRMRKFGEDNANKLYGKIVLSLAMTINKIKKVMYIHYYPITSILSITKYFNRVKRLHKIHEFDIIVSVYNPIEALISGMRMKKKFSKTKWIIYSLDTLSNTPKNKFLSKKFINNKGWKWEQKFYKYADLIINMKSHENHHKGVKYKKYYEKMIFSDIPLFRKLECDNYCFSNKNEDKNYDINLVYTGALDINFRNPSYLCEVVLRLLNFENIRIDFYTRGNAESVLKKYEEETEYHIKRRGYVSLKKSIQAICNADILISIGNYNSDMIPSKIFEYMSTGKKIVHFYSSVNDPCINYYKKYPSALLVYENNSIDDNILQILKFIRSEPINHDFNRIKEIFNENTADYTVTIIDKILDWREEKCL